MVQFSDVALAGMAATEYVYTRFGQGAVLITSITLGVAGLNVEMVNERAELVPQPLEAVTLIVPPVYPAG
jgi:hypothetical protein